MRARGLAALLLLLVALPACERKPQAPTVPPPPLSPALSILPAAFSDLPGWREDRVSEALPALRLSCRRLLKLEDAAPVGPNALGGTAGAWKRPCAAIAAIANADEGALRRLLEAQFRPVQVLAGSEANGLFTGYYEVELQGARAPSERFPVPLYRRPPDLLSANLGSFADDLAGRTVFGRVAADRFVPYFSRAEIEAGALAGRGLELLWLPDPVEAFLLHVQGSGRVRLAEGGTIRVGFAASNGLPFFAIGRALIDRGALPADKASMPEIRAWLKAHAQEGRQIMDRNRRYIFFREIGEDGPVGAEGVALTAGRSLAVDTALLPLGAPVWLDAHWPGDPARPLRRLMVAQDTGSAIKGAVRGDFFWGTGDAAFAEAGRMKSTGRYWFLLPADVASSLTR